ncbi:MAG: hypothetical protein A2284_00750 [Deltaproteobacteria bacterium RIFOXYA12_FULL_61_11]|nr:MAG: hypothetical protein A2284_00750 [Deltaproteobacteria bacterium RIFOXYA12_FULL_61_11]
MQIMQLDHLTRQEQLKTSCELERERIEEWFHTRINELQELTKTRKEATRIEFALEQKLATIDLEYQRKRLSLGKQASEAKRKLEQEIAIIRNSQEQYKTTLRQEIIARFSQQRSNLNERHTKRLELVKKQALKELREIRKDKAQLLRSPALLGTEEERRIDDQILSIKRDYHSTAQRYEIEQQQEIEALTMAEEKELLGLASLVSSSINTKVLELTTKIKTYELRTKQIQEQIEVDRQEREEELTHILNHALAKVDTEREQLRLELHNLHRQELAKNNLSCNQELQRLLAEKELAEQSLRARYQQIVRIEISALNELRSSAMRAKDHDLRVATFIAHKRHRNLTVLSLTLEASRTETSRVRTSHMYMEGLP